LNTINRGMKTIIFQSINIVVSSLSNVAAKHTLVTMVVSLLIAKTELEGRDAFTKVSWGHLFVIQLYFTSRMHEPPPPPEVARFFHGFMLFRPTLERAEYSKKSYLPLNLYFLHFVTS
jgi:hypothetical protein